MKQYVGSFMATRVRKRIRPGQSSLLTASAVRARRVPMFTEGDRVM